MKLFLILAIPFLTVSCASVEPMKFPEPPAKLMEKPVELKTVGQWPTEISLTDKTDSGIPFTTVSKVITDNYTQCNVYRETIFSWQNWVTEQKKVFK
jgi:hypothetical protein